MRIFKKISILLFSFILLTLVFIFFYFQHLKPDYKGNFKLKNISEKVDVYYDNIGVPHIYAQNQNDAYIAFGYAHAQDRLWQMEIARRIAAGRLSEIFGKDKENQTDFILNKDKFFLGLGIQEAAKKTIKNLDTTTQSYKLTMAYLDGINQFITNGPTPIEYKIIGVKKDKFELLDIYNVFGYMSFSFAAAHKTDPFLSKLKEKLDPIYINELGIDIDPKTTLIPNYNPSSGIQSDLVSNVNKIMTNLPIAPFIGSNSWVIGPEKTATGKVIFANDPHISFSQPGVWYQSHIVCPDFEIYGFNLALTPFPLLGHNRNHAYGLTMFENDDIDFYSEEINPENENEYLLNGQFTPFAINEYDIKIKGGTTKKIVVKSTNHGPIMNDFIQIIDEKRPIAMNWVYNQFDNKMLAASFGLVNSKDINDFINSVEKIHAPGLNVMYGDVDDNFAWFAGAKLYEHENNVNTKFILDGANGSDSINYLDFSQNPQAINPEWNFVYSANNQPDKINNRYYPGYYLPEDRAKRIVDQIQNKTGITIDDTKKLITDVTSSIAPNLIDEIIKNIDEKILTQNELVAYKILNNWNGSFELNQVAPTIYTKLKYQFYKNVFLDELGKEGFKQFLNTTLSKRQFAKQILATNSKWNDDIATLNFIEDKKFNIIKSFKESIRLLEKQHGNHISNWQWKKSISVMHEHAIGDKLSFLGLNFNVGPFQTSGTNEVLNNQIFNLNDSGIYKVQAGPSTRRVIDFSDIENSFAVIPTGQSGNIFSKHYKDQAEKYLKNEFFTMLLNKEEIQKLEDKVVFSPK